MFLRKSPYNRYGWKKQLNDIRDLKYKVDIAKKLPPMVDLSPLCPPIKSQGELGSCAFNSTTSAIEFLELKDKHKYQPLSRLFAYYNARVIEGTIKIDSGSTIKDAIKSYINNGVCVEGVWPYRISVFTQKPNSKAYKQAIDHKLLNYSYLYTINDIKGCLTNGLPVVYGMSVYSSFESNDVAKTGIVPMPQLDEEFLGGHSCYLCGYDDSKKWFIGVNSWGNTWGDKGKFYIGYDYISKLASDFTVIQKTCSE